MSTLTSRRAPVALAALAALLLCALAGAPKANAGIIFACAKQLGGSVHIVTAGTKCKRGEVKLRWAGATGPTGTTGLTGPQGAHRGRRGSGRQRSDRSAGRDRGHRTGRKRRIQRKRRDGARRSGRGDRSHRCDRAHRAIRSHGRRGDQRARADSQHRRRHDGVDDSVRADVHGRCAHRRHLDPGR